MLACASIQDDIEGWGSGIIVGTAML